MDNPLYVEERDFARPSHKGWLPPRYSTAGFKDYARVLHSASWRRLQGKMQLFPIGTNEILRTRLTHSLEVMEIAVRIASWLNGPNGPSYFRQGPKFEIDRDVVATAAIAHDLGHPPFGHSGEYALNAAMKENGVFEGNAQTLRILTNLESRHDTVSIRRINDGPLYGALQNDRPQGLDLTFRSLASVIKYDRNADHEMEKKLRSARKKDRPAIMTNIYKGYYSEEEHIVSEIKRRLLGPTEGVRLSTIECQIMDLADDIAYSTYDLEDAMIAGVVTPFDVIACKDVYLEQICLHLNKKLGELNYAARIDQKDILAILMRVFSNILSYADDTDYAENTIFQRIAFVARSYRENLLHTHSQAIRRRFMETLIEGAVRSITVDVNEEVPMLSRISMAIGKRLEIECLKAFTFEVVTSSQNNQIAAHRSAKIVKKLWEELSQDDKGSLLPDDVRPLFRKAEGREADCIVRDLIATLTDKEAIELYKKVSA